LRALFLHVVAFIASLEFVNDGCTGMLCTRSYGSVYKAQHKESGQVLAIKQVPVDTDLQEIIKEISIMQQCDSPYIVKYYGSYFKNTDLWVSFFTCVVDKNACQCSFGEQCFLHNIRCVKQKHHFDSKCIGYIELKHVILVFVMRNFHRYDWVCF